ncbi:MAG TPA: hypothetical protein VGO93_26520 [Candidatus Xenobia bacterium]|jgi:hypothetical protein
MATLYATFPDGALAKKAVGALLDHGADKDSISLIGRQGDEQYWTGDSMGKEGISTTTGKDAAHAAAKGAGIGLGIGILAGIASLIIPGFGIVIGGGALATAIGSAVGTTAAGAIAGGVEGFMVDQGVPEKVATTYREALEHGQGMLALTLPSGKLEAGEAQEVVAKYGASQVFLR